MKDIKIPIGPSNFKEIRESGFYYIDKTSIISTLIRENSTTLLFTRPRRFGKTTLMSMLSSFFDIRERSEKLFEGLYVMSDHEAIENWMNKYPLLCLSFKDIDADNFSQSFLKLSDIISDLYTEYKHVITNSNDEKLKTIFSQIIPGSASIETIMISLNPLVKAVREYYGKKVIVLIDEYDVPLANAEKNGFYSEMLNILRSFFGVLKDNENVKIAILSGCLRISKESLFTGLNNFSSFSLLSNKYAEYFGFTEEEVLKLLDDADLSEYADLFKKWYDGYRIGKFSIYSSWDVVNYVSDLISDKNACPKNYWANTSSNDIIRRFIDITNASIADDYSDLLEGRSISKMISENLTYDNLYQREANIWSLLFETGYLTLSAQYREGEETSLTIPNEEIRLLFKNDVDSWFKESVKKSERNDLFTLLFKKDASSLSTLLTQYLRFSISYYDYKEDFYHAFVTGLFASTGEYRVKSNREEGEGRPDLIVSEGKGTKAAIIEFKVAKKKEEIDDLLNLAINQIQNNGYENSDDFFNTELVKVGIVFFKKSAFVKFL